MYYLIYKITDGNIYIGQHQTEEINDGYLGSGTIISNIIKVRKKDLKKEVLFIFDNFEEMNEMEKLIVDEEFIKRKDVYNIVEGGLFFNTKGYLTAKEKGSSKFNLIPTEEYDRNIHVTPSSGKLSVYNKLTNKTESIELIDYNEKMHKKVFGGIVAIKNGVKQYVTKEEFEKEKYTHVHEGKITAKILSTGEIKHIDKEEFYKNSHLYEHSTKGKVTGKHKITGEKRRFSTEEVNENIKKEYFFSTSGQLTVFDVEEKKFKNIDKNDYNKLKHKLSSSKMFICYDENGRKLFEYFGTKKDFFSTYAFPSSVWKCITDEKSFYTNRKKGSEYNNCYFQLIDWKKLYKLKD